MQRSLDSLRYVEDMFSFLLISSVFLTGTVHFAIPKTQDAPALRQGKTAPQLREGKTAPQLISEGMAAYGRKDYALAAELLVQAVGKGATQPDLFYNAACALALTGERDEALRYLERSIKVGYRNPTHLKYDVDLNSLHDDPGWEKIVAACEGALAKYQKEHSEPSNARFITADID